MIVLDVDGVLTDAGLIIGTGGLEIMKFNVQDGAGIALARRAGYRVGIISGRLSDLILRRAELLGIEEVYHGRFHKLPAYEEILKKYHYKDSEICYMGDDILDLPIIRRAGFSVAVANAVREVKVEADYITKLPGGNGAVREVLDLILDVSGKKRQVIEALLKEEERELIP
ncbi:MAG: HAD-IIIA family hydrolase [Deltaproteobacteria bacterium]|nr:HAD-IIIA family hydrolase [Deltaproteobacteria bacterium]